MLTPMDIHNKEFRRAFRGYNELEVNEFLDEVIEDYEKLYKENLELKDRIGLLNDKLQNYIGLEQTLNNTLVMAQKTADEMTANAKEKAENIIKEAEETARKIIEKANQEVIEIKKEYENIKKQMLEFKLKFKTLLEAELRVLTDEMIFDKSNNKEKSDDIGFSKSSDGTDIIE